MKKIFGLLLSVITLIFVSCNKDDFLDQPLRGNQQLDDFFKSGDAAESFLNGVYQKVNGEDWFQLNFPRQIFEMATDDNWAGNTLSPSPDISNIALYNNLESNAAYFEVFWRHSFIGITRANIALERIPNVDMDDQLKTRLLAEAHFLRGWFYFDLARNFGGLPIIRTFSEILDVNIINTKRSTLDQTYDFVEENLLEAIENLPSKSDYPLSERGRATKGAAQTLLAKVYLYREKWEEAKSMAENVINSAQYQLEPEFQNIWSVNNHHGVESIFEVEYINDPQFDGVGGHYSTTYGSVADQGWGWCTPTSDLENAFLSENDDVRLQSTIIKHGEQVFGDPLVSNFDTNLSQNKSGRINRKFYIPRGDRQDNFERGTHALPYIRLRYADLLLIHAEASYFAGDPVSAISSYKEVRDRVGLFTDIFLTGDELRDAIWKERRLELALEQQRIYDLRRQKIDGVPRIATILGPEGSFVKYNTEESKDQFETTNLQEPQDKGILFDVNKHLLWPIPPNEIQRSSGNITQNPGY